MKVLIDECAPKGLKHSLATHGHESLTVQEAGWSGKQNGELLALAETKFDVLITVDTKSPIPTKPSGTQNRHCNYPVSF
jgi:predicted nuclease of predicted toxin-antitoxin system